MFSTNCAVSAFHLDQAIDNQPKYRPTEKDPRSFLESRPCCLGPPLPDESPSLIHPSQKPCERHPASRLWPGHRKSGHWTTPGRGQHDRKRSRVERKTPPARRKFLKLEPTRITGYTPAVTLDPDGLFHITSFEKSKKVQFPYLARAPVKSSSLPSIYYNPTTLYTGSLHSTTTSNTSNDSLLVPELFPTFNCDESPHCRHVDPSVGFRVLGILHLFLHVLLINRLRPSLLTRHFCTSSRDLPLLKMCKVRGNYHKREKRG